DSAIPLASSGWYIGGIRNRILREVNVSVPILYRYTTSGAQRADTSVPSRYTAETRICAVVRGHRLLTSERVMPEKMFVPMETTIIPRRTRPSILPLASAFIGNPSEIRNTHYISTPAGTESSWRNHRIRLKLENAGFKKFQQPTIHYKVWGLPLC